MDYTDALASVSLFKDMPRDLLARLAGVARSYSLYANDVLFWEGAPGDEMYVIASGTAKVYKRNEAGGQDLITKVGAGSYFGEIAFLIENQVRTATLRTVKDMTVLGFRRRDVEPLMAEQPAIGLYLYRALAQGLADRLSATTQTVAHYKAIAAHRA